MRSQLPRSPPPEGTGEPLLHQATNAAKCGGVRKKGANSGVKPWLLVESTGRSQVVEVGKHYIMRRTGLLARDLRILDPSLSYPSTILGRERAIVINLEHIKAIITAQQFLLLNPTDPIVAPFVQELQDRISCHLQAQECDMEESQSGEQQIVENRDRSKFLPFEFVVFEACLEAACTCLDSEAKSLEQEAYPALDKLTSKITTLYLERVRVIKSRLVAITGRVQKVRDELENLLDDDKDMIDMYLTQKLQQQQPENISMASLNEQDDMDEVVQSKMDDRVPAEISMEGDKSPIISHGDLHGTHSSRRMHLDAAELEMLLEAYFIQIDGTLNNLSTLREYVEDTEDYINIMLDDRQNHLLQIGVMLTTATLVVTAAVVVAGVLSINIKDISLFQNTYKNRLAFFWTAGGSTAGGVLLYVIAIAWYKYKRLIE